MMSKQDGCAKVHFGRRPILNRLKRIAKQYKEGNTKKLSMSKLARFLIKLAMSIMSNLTVIPNLSDELKKLGEEHRCRQ